jgi:hypothetical protein
MVILHPISSLQMAKSSLKEYVTQDSIFNKEAFVSSTFSG